jgi:hypothetical protein
MMKDNGIATLESPDGVEVVTRGEGAEQIRFLINHNETETVFDGQTLKPFEVLIQIL